MKKIIKIAKIVNEFTFIITGGSSDGIQEQDAFKIIQPEDFSVIDPDTGESLGSYKLIKETIYAETIYDNFSICRTEVYKDEVTVGGINLTPFSGKTKYVTKHKKLDVDTDEITGGLTADPIKVGDIVEKINA